MKESKPIIDDSKLEKEPEKGPGGSAGKIITLIAVCVSLFQLFSAWHGAFFAAQQRAIHWAFISTLILLIYPLKRGEQKQTIPFYDIILAMVSVASVIYLLQDYQNLVLRSALPKTLDIIAGATMMLIILEAARRSVGYPLVIVAVVFLIYAYFGEYMPGVFAHRPYSLSRIINYQFTTLEGMLGIPLGVAATFIALFLIFAAFLEKSGGGKSIMNLAFALTGWSSGGPAKASVVGSSLFASISGSAVANVVGTGTFTIPLMKKTGYETNFAGAVETVSSTGGQIMPPMMGAAAFIIAEYTTTPYIKVCLHALIPAVLFYFAVLMMVHLNAQILGLKGMNRELLPKIRQPFIEGGHLFFSVIVLVVLLIKQYSPMTAALWSVIVLIIFATLKKSSRMSAKQIYAALATAGKNMCVVSAACACAGIVIGVVTLSGIGFQISDFITEASRGYLFIALIFTAITSIIMGMGLPVTACYLLLAILGAPALVRMGAPLMGAHMFVFYFGVLSCITPPVAIVAYAGAAVAQGEPMKVAFNACKLGIVAFIVPFMFIYEPALLFIGDIGHIAIAFLTALIGIFFISVATMGYMTKHVDITRRVLFSVSALFMIYPGIYTDLIGFILGLILGYTLVGKRILKTLLVKLSA